jgi:DEAD/DEAH box helicase domain-containing protein
MKNYLVFDIETRNTFQEVGSSSPADLDISVVSIYNSETDETSSFLQEDFNKMWPLFEKTSAIIGYNTEHFDIPLLNKYYAGNLESIKSIDLMVYIKESLGRRPKLDDIAAATLGNKKSAHGLEAVKWWKEGKIKEIIKYCEIKDAIQFMKTCKKIYNLKSQIHHYHFFLVSPVLFSFFCVIF